MRKSFQSYVSDIVAREVDLYGLDQHQELERMNYLLDQTADYIGELYRDLCPPLDRADEVYDRCK